MADDVRETCGANQSTSKRKSFALNLKRVARVWRAPAISVLKNFQIIVFRKGTADNQLKNELVILQGDHLEVEDSVLFSVCEKNVIISFQGKKITRMKI